jgi:hypothetical protein
MDSVYYMSPNDDLELWRKTVETCRECLALDQDMLARLGPLGHDKAGDPENYVDPSLWEQFIAARNDLVDFTVSSIHVLTVPAMKSQEAKSESRTDEDEKSFAERTELENRLVTSLKEMVDLESKLTSYLSENLNVLKETIDSLNKNQTVFSQYAKNRNKPEPGYFNSEA